MSGAAMAKMFARELLARQVQPRQLPPSTLLGDTGVLAAMREGGQIDGRTAAGYLYHSARICQVLQGRTHCWDVGCGSGVQLLQVAVLNPAIHFTGVDRSACLLAQAAADAERLGLGNVTWRQDDITTLDSVPNGSVAAVICTMALHDLPDVAALARTLQSIARVSTPHAALYIEDFCRLKCAESIKFFLQLNAPPTPDAFSALYRASLEAAFTRPELSAAVGRALPNATCHTTFLVPFLLVAHSPTQPLPHAQKLALQTLRAALPPSARRDLEELQKFFALGGFGGKLFD